MHKVRHSIVLFVVLSLFANCEPFSGVIDVNLNLNQPQGPPPVNDKAPLICCGLPDGPRFVPDFKCGELKGDPVPGEACEQPKPPMCRLPGGECIEYFEDDKCAELGGEKVEGDACGHDPQQPDVKPNDEKPQEPNDEKPQEPKQG